MACLHITTPQLEREFGRIFADGVAVPSKCWVDHYHDYHTYIRAVYGEKFPAVAADKLLELRRVLQDLYGPKASVSIVVFLNDDEWPFFAAHRLYIHTAR